MLLLMMMKMILGRRGGGRVGGEGVMVHVLAMTEVVMKVAPNVTPKTLMLLFPLIATTLTTPFHPLRRSAGSPR